MTTGKTLSALFDAIEEQRLIDSLMAMIAIPSINPFRGEVRKDYREQEMAEYYADRMSDLGLEVGMREVVKGRPNVWGRIKGKGNGSSVMLSGHLDTVGVENYPDALTPRVENNRVYGRGACDMKDALASYLEIARVLREADIDLDGDLIITGVADEEDQLIGSHDFGKHGPWADFGIIGEPSEMMVCCAHKGQLGYLIRCFGQAVHSSRPELGVNAIEGITHFIEALGRYRDELKARAPHALCGHGRCCPSVIKGGTIVSTVADYCELEVDRRTVPGETSQDIHRELQELVESVLESQPEFKFEIHGPTIEIGSLDVSADNPVVRAVLQAVQSVTGKSVAAEAFFGSTDAPNFGFPMLIYGAGSIKQAHTVNEYVEVSDMLIASRVYLNAVLALAAPAILTD